MIKINRPVLAEFLATTLFVYTGCGSVFAYKASGDGTIVGIALAFGLSITALASTVGHHSGGHMNPIVTIAMAILGKLDVLSAYFYIIAQCLGAILGSVLLMTLDKRYDIKTVCNAINHNNTTTGGAFLMEMVLSFILVFVVIETAISKKNKNHVANSTAPIPIGLAVFMAHIVGIPFTGTSINPARSFGPAVVSGSFQDLWLFLVAPILGGSLAAITCKYVLDATEEDKEETLDEVPLKKNDSSVEKAAKKLIIDPVENLVSTERTNLNTETSNAEMTYDIESFQTVDSEEP